MGSGDWEYKYYDEHRVMCEVVGSLYCTPESNKTPYVDYT